MALVPTTRRQSQSCTACSARDHTPGGSISSNQTTSGRSKAPHSTQRGSAGSGSQPWSALYVQPEQRTRRIELKLGVEPSHYERGERRTEPRARGGEETAAVDGQTEETVPLGGAR